ncbi:thiamine transport system substrate-binding protein [Hypnocyclicus thermotrophus]|uniref:Thiamine transport system substrate-binding protein n=1 Tax=Hypnocyclicus thermotrophus TaxID=1627895 RepID=A0AA46I650_9FUSO|nr:thiamine ABC transporter substrate-binding protein [Hypnocyclicus thermotrophus]TDT71938.1 thiamine transport system substrate-binding protein [Hypnocyclicus thermotrophus]
MKKILLIFLLLSNFIFGETLTVYIPDAMKWMEKEIKDSFESQYGVELKFVKFEGAAKIVSRLKLEKINPKADIVVGLSSSTLALAKKEEILKQYKPVNSNKIKDIGLVIDKDYFATTFDYGGLAIIYAPDRLKQVPTSFNDIIKLDKSLIVEDPRTSTTGQDFLLWTIAIYKDNWKEFWEKLKPAILTITPGWSEAFNKFEAKEAPMMVSYATDGAYSTYYYGGTSYKALIPNEGGYVQIEGAAIINKKDIKDSAYKFIEFLLSDEFQEKIPLNQWMFPVTNVKLPAAFDYAEEIKNPVTVSGEDISNNLEKWLKEWEELMKK